MTNKVKVNIKKLGKRFSWKGMELSTPCKVFIDVKDTLRFKILMKQLGVNEKEYTIGEIKESAKIKSSNEAAKKVAENTAKNISDTAKEELKSDEKSKKEDPKPPKPVEVKSSDDKKVDSPKKDEPKKEDLKKDNSKKEDSKSKK
jgi:hypothetical protein